MIVVVEQSQNSLGLVAYPSSKVSFDKTLGSLTQRQPNLFLSTIQEEDDIKLEFDCQA